MRLLLVICFIVVVKSEAVRSHSGEKVHKTPRKAEEKVEHAARQATETPCTVIFNSDSKASSSEPTEKHHKTNVEAKVVVAENNDSSDESSEDVDNKISKNRAKIRSLPSARLGKGKTVKSTTKATTEATTEKATTEATTTEKTTTEATTTEKTTTEATTTLKTTVEPTTEKATTEAAITKTKSADKSSSEELEETTTEATTTTIVTTTVEKEALTTTAPSTTTTIQTTIEEAVRTTAPSKPLSNDSSPEEVECPSSVDAYVSVKINSYLFDHYRVYIIRNGRVVRVAAIQDIFPAGPKRVNAAFYDRDKNLVVLVRKRTVYAFRPIRETTFEADSAFPKELPQNIAFNPSGGMRWHDRRQMFLSKDGKFALYDEYWNKSLMSANVTDYFKGLPPKVRGVSKWIENEANIFTKHVVYKYKVADNSVKGNGTPLSAFLHCE